MTDADQATKLYAELPDFQAAVNYASEDRKAELYEATINFVSQAVGSIRQLNEDEQVRGGIIMCQGQLVRLRSENSTDAFSKWVVEAYLITSYIGQSEKQSQVRNFCKTVIDKAEKIHNPF